MAREIFISYSRRDQEFVERLASDLNAQVAGVWFDQSAIQPGAKWQDEIREGIRNCKAFILVLSPDAQRSQHVQAEVQQALELGKRIFPVIYRAADWQGQFATLVRDVQTLDLRSGSYTDNFHRLVDGLVEAGAARMVYERPFLREPIKPGLDVVFRRIPGWAFAWSAGWLIFWAVVVLILAILVATQVSLGGDDLLNFAVILTSGGVGGFLGGLLAGLLTMLTLRPNAPSISWKHMSPTIRIWGISGSLGMIVSGLVTVMMLAANLIYVPSTETDCTGLGLGECLGQAFGAAVGEAIAILLITAAVFLVLVTATWFLTGMFTGWQVVRHIRALEPGITTSQGWKVSTSWGCGAIVAAIATFLVLGMLASLLGL
jgi:hypothetical protein